MSPLSIYLLIPCKFLIFHQSATSGSAIVSCITFHIKLVSSLLFLYKVYRDILNLGGLDCNDWDHCDKAFVNLVSCFWLTKFIRRCRRYFSSQNSGPKRLLCSVHSLSVCSTDDFNPLEDLMTFPYMRTLVVCTLGGFKWTIVYSRAA